jgi:hypothetical protein
VANPHKDKPKAEPNKKDFPEIREKSALFTIPIALMIRPHLATSPAARKSCKR